MVHCILKTAIHPLAEFIFKYLSILHFLAAKYAKGLFENRYGSSNDDAGHCHNPDWNWHNLGWHDAEGHDEGNDEEMSETG